MRYPTELPTADLKNIFDFIRGNPDKLSVNLVIESGWWVVGYGLSLGLPVNTGFAGVQCDWEPLAAQIELHLGYNAGPDGFSKINWPQLITMILQFVQQLIPKTP